MIISFFEEFPTVRNRAKLHYLSKPTKLYLAANSVGEFRKIVPTIKNQNVKECIYWPILQRKEGYWISPFARRKALLRIFRELEREKIPVMLDLELPTTQNPLLYLTQSLHFVGNKKIIRKFIHDYQGEVYLVEYYPEGKRSERVLELLGLHYPCKNTKVIKMFYRSLHHFSDDFLQKELQQGKQEYGKKFIAGLGVIAPGIQGNELVLSPQQLERDLQIAKKAGMKEVIVFRLGGLDKECGKMLRKFSRNP